MPADDLFRTVPRRLLQGTVNQGGGDLLAKGPFNRGRQHGCSQRDGPQRVIDVDGNQGQVHGISFVVSTV